MDPEREQSLSIMKICVCIPDDLSADPFHISAIKQLGKHMGKHNETLICHGYNGELADIFVTEAWKNGAKILSILPETFPDRQKEFTHSTVIYRGNDKWKRKLLMEDCADAFIVIPESKEIVQELFDILLLKKYGRHNKPVYLINIKGQCDLLVELLEQEEYGGLYVEISEKKLENGGILF